MTDILRPLLGRLSGRSDLRTQSEFTITPSARLSPKARTIVTDHEWTGPVTDERYHDHVFVRVSGKDVLFQSVDFRYSTFDTCYLRGAKFRSCDFTGCRFAGTNLHGATFDDCTFDYVVFERTIIDVAVLETCSNRENLKMRFAQTLRANFQSLGDADAVNKAMLVELDATRTHLSRAWRSREDYYRKKYAGLERVIAFVTWLKFVTSDAVWGNGERIGRLLRSALILVLLLAFGEALLARDPSKVEDWLGALAVAPGVLLGTAEPNYPDLILAVIALARYVLLGLFVSVLVRRLARR